MEEDLKKIMQPKKIKIKNNDCGTGPGNLVIFKSSAGVPKLAILLNDNRKSKNYIQTLARLGGKFLIITRYFAAIEKINHNLQHLFRY